MNQVLSPCASPSFVMPSADTIGSAFAALNPPVDPIRTAGLDPSPVASPPTEQATVETKPKQRWKTLPICGVVTISNQALWSPKSVCAVPPSVCDRLGMQAAAVFAIAYNQCEHARLKRRWCCVTNRGTVVILNGIPATERPLNPADFPPCVRSGLTFLEAESATTKANCSRHSNAIVPREWTISLRRADCVDDSIDHIGGAV